MSKNDIKNKVNGLTIALTNDKTVYDDTKVYLNKIARVATNELGERNITVVEQAALETAERMVELFKEG